MLNYIFDFEDIDGKKFVPYLMKQEGGNVLNKMPFGKAMGILAQSGQEVRATDTYPGYPITSDGVFFFAGKTVPINRE